MTKVIHLSSPRAGARVHSSATPHNQTNGASSSIERQQAIENALSMALYFVRQPGSTLANLWAATARANRALTLLKQASQGHALASTENATGRV